MNELFNYKKTYVEGHMKRPDFNFNKTNISSIVEEDIGQFRNLYSCYFIFEAYILSLDINNRL